MLVVLKITNFRLVHTLFSICNRTSVVLKSLYVGEGPVQAYCEHGMENWKWLDKQKWRLSVLILSDTDGLFAATLLQFGISQYTDKRGPRVVVPQSPHHATVLRPFFRDHPGEPVPEENFWTLWCKGRLTEADTLTIRLGTTPS